MNFIPIHRILQPLLPSIIMRGGGSQTERVIARWCRAIFSLSPSHCCLPHVTVSLTPPSCHLPHPPVSLILPSPSCHRLPHPVVSLILLSFSSYHLHHVTMSLILLFPSCRCLPRPVISLILTSPSSCCLHHVTVSSILPFTSSFHLPHLSYPDPLMLHYITLLLLSCLCFSCGFHPPMHFPPLT